MIEALYKIGQAIYSKVNQEEPTFWDSIGDNYKNVFKIMIDINDIPKFIDIEYEEYDPIKDKKYIFKGKRGQSADDTPTTKITKLEKTFPKYKKFFETFLKNNESILQKDDIEFIQALKNTIEQNSQIIYNKIEELISKNKGPGIITLSFIKNDNQYYVGDLEIFTKPFLSDELSYKSYYYKYNIESKATNKYCYICHKKADEVWGFVNTYNFYTVDKESFVTGGFDQSKAWKNYPLCKDCAKILDMAKKNIKENFAYKFCGLNYYIIPEIVYEDSALLNKILFRIKSYKEFTLQGDKAITIESSEDKILSYLSQESNLVNFNFLFYKEKNNAFNILLYIQDIPPTYLGSLIKAKKKVDEDDGKQYKIFHIKNDKIDFNFSFKSIRDFFPNNSRDGNFDKTFLSILNSIFTKKSISAEIFFNRFMEKIRKTFYEEDIWLTPEVLKSYKILIYLEEIGILDRRKNNMVKDDSVYGDFFNENSVFDDYTKKALFLEGILAQKLINIQFKNRNATPFRARLNGLKIDGKIAQRLLPEIINKLEEYDKNYYKELEGILAQYLLKSDFSKYSIDEMSYYFTLGMTLENQFDKKEKGGNSSVD